MADGRSSVLVAHGASSAHGTLRTSLPSGEPCSGSFSEVGLADVSGFGVCSVPLTENSEAALAVLTCAPGHVLRCTLARRYDDGFSYGACKDERGAEYSLMF